MEITIMEARTLIEERLSRHAEVNVYGRWHCGPKYWGDADVNIDAGHDDPSPDLTDYKLRFAEIAKQLRTLGHIVEDHGSSLTVYRRGSEEAERATMLQSFRAGIQAGDIVVLRHNSGTECKRVEACENEGFLRFGENELPMTRKWVTAILRTNVPISKFKVSFITHYVKIEEDKKLSYYDEVGNCHCLSRVFCALASDTRRRLTLHGYRLGSDGTPGDFISNIGTFYVWRSGMQVFIEEEIER